MKENKRSQSIVELMSEKMDTLSNEDQISAFISKLHFEYRSQIVKAYEDGKLDQLTNLSGNNYYDKTYGNLTTVNVPKPLRLVRIKFKCKPVPGDNEYLNYSLRDFNINKVAIACYIEDGDKKYYKIPFCKRRIIDPSDIIEWSYVSDEEAFLFYEVFKNTKYMTYGEDDKVVKSFLKLLPDLINLGLCGYFKSEVSKVDSFEKLINFKVSKEDKEKGVTYSIHIQPDGIIYFKRKENPWNSLLEGLSSVIKAGIDTSELEIDLEGLEVDRVTSKDINNLKRILSGTKNPTYTKLDEFKTEKKVTEIKNYINIDLEDKKEVLFNGINLFYTREPRSGASCDYATLQESMEYTKHFDVKLTCAPSYYLRSEYNPRVLKEFYSVSKGISKEISYSEFWGHKPHKPSRSLYKIKVSSLVNGLIIKKLITTLKETSFYGIENDRLNYKFGAIVEERHDILKIQDKEFYFYNKTFSLIENYFHLGYEIKKGREFTYDEIANLVKENGNKYSVINVMKILDPRINIIHQY